MIKTQFLVILLIAFIGFSCQSDQNIVSIRNIDYDVVIVGGGFSGLTAAYQLRGKNILVLEKEKAIGGRCMSGNWNGFHYPKGTEYIGKPESLMKKIFKRLAVKAEQIPAPTDGVAYNGNFYFSEELLDYLNAEEQKQYNELKQKLELLANNDIEDVIFEEQEYLKEYKKLDQQSVRKWLDKEGYASLIQKFIDIENRGLFGTDNANYSMLFNIPEMAFNLPLVDSIDESDVYSFNQGMFSVVEAFAQQIGNNIITSASVNGVKVNRDKSVDITYLKDGNSHTVTAKTVVMATPAPVTEYIVKNHLSSEVKNTLKNLQYSKYVTINFFTKKRLLHETWSVSCIDEGQVVTLYDVIRPQVSDDYRGKSILSVYMAPENTYDKNFAKQSDQKLLTNAYQTLNKYYPGFENEVVDYDITRFEYAFPVFAPNYSSNVEILTSDKSLRGPIFLAGDYMVYATVDGAFISGDNAAKLVLGYLKQQQ
ncbi:FAD-dependent oxidoreductase [Prolixibacteraceae bacterium JC049]|nr:FAD-dependent oxidoreductase [Prolixibacteraceae bacterium JC049]